MSAAAADTAADMTCVTSASLCVSDATLPKRCSGSRGTRAERSTETGTHPSEVKYLNVSTLPRAARSLTVLERMVMYQQDAPFGAAVYTTHCSGQPIQLLPSKHTVVILLVMR